jgi:hypothetical protein
MVTRLVRNCNHMIDSENAYKEEFQKRKGSRDPLS